MSRHVDLTICPKCSKDFAYPVDWHEAEDPYWYVWLRCADCEWHYSGRFDQATVDRFDRRLDELTDALVSDLHTYTRANMHDELVAFSEALALDIILPEDFC